MKFKMAEKTEPGESLAHPSLWNSFFKQVSKITVFSDSMHACKSILECVFFLHGSGKWKQGVTQREAPIPWLGRDWRRGLKTWRSLGSCLHGNLAGSHSPCKQASLSSPPARGIEMGEVLVWVRVEAGKLPVSKGLFCFGERTEKRLN